MRQKTSFSLPLWNNLNISIDKFVSEVQHTELDFTNLTEWSKIEEWVNTILEWRASNIGHDMSHGCKIGIYGELYAAALLVGHNHKFNEWLFTMAIIGKGDNTNKDLQKDWLNIAHNIEVKTVSKHNNSVRIEQKRNKPFEYPELLLVVKELNDNIYSIHSLTKRKILQNVVQIYPAEKGIARIFRLNDLTLIEQF